ncbi:MAG TPA: endonuclease/exonuclease/phosphatase family protein [Candidatus Saccharimonadales bacterium]|jgi:endonuclease/exonuclease/phosphatase family metal-dependent hydrolase
MRLATLNIQSGGFESYASTAGYPQRMGQIKEAVHVLDVDAIGLVDTYRWAEVFGNEGVREEFGELGFSDAYAINLGDPILDGKLGVAILSKKPLQNIRTIDMAGRSALAAEVSDGEETLEFVSAYLAYDSEKQRVEQAKGLVAGLGKKPYVVAGDLNGTNRGLTRKNTSVFGGEALQHLIVASPKVNDLHRAAAEMTIGETMRIFEAAGLTDADERRRRTLHIHGIGLLALDHVLYPPKLVQVTNLKVPRTKVFRKASDHFPMVFEVQPLS